MNIEISVKDNVKKGLKEWFLMWVLQTAVIILLIIGCVHIWILKQRNDYTSSLIANQMNSSEELKKTLAMGCNRQVVLNTFCSLILNTFAIFDISTLKGMEISYV